MNNGELVLDDRTFFHLYGHRNHTGYGKVESRHRFGLCVHSP